GSTGTSLQLVGRYDPPGGRIGRLVDRVAMHRVAEAGARSFLRRVADGLVGANTRVAPWPLPGP
ncbi:MAG TPA: hypothetical protein VI854_07255, partial [Acidimicrobiia bacterium]|nr:hypothetical protein [Acidimicrobiia bacterium]